MKTVLKMSVPEFSLIGIALNRKQEVYDRFRYLIDNRVVLHNDQLNVDYIVLEVEVSEDMYSREHVVRVTVDMLDELDKDIQRQLDTLKTSLGELLPQKEVRE